MDKELGGICQEALSDLRGETEEEDERFYFA
jgi:hypothetical protein